MASKRLRARRWAVLCGLLCGAYTLVGDPAPAQAKGKVRFGLGGGFGDPFGPSAKLFLHPQHALQFDLGWGLMHHLDGITHFNYLFHFAPFVSNSTVDFGLYIGGGIGLAFWGRHRWGSRGRNCYDPPGPDDWECDGGPYYYYSRHYGRGYGGGAAMIIRAPVGIYLNWVKVPIDTVLETGWSPYVVPWDPFHGDFSVKVRYYF